MAILFSIGGPYNLGQDLWRCLKIFLFLAQAVIIVFAREEPFVQFGIGHYGEHSFEIILH